MAGPYPKSQIGVFNDLVITSNAANVLRDACEQYPNPDVWEASVASGDFIVARGDTAGAGWIEISKDPTSPNSETILTLKPRMSMPMKLTTMVSLTHRNAGEHIFSQEFVSDDVAYGGEPVPDPTPVQILNASQTTTTITINFASPPPERFRIGQVVSVYGFVDTRLNVNSATIASVPTPTQITIVGNDYTFTSTTIGTTLGNAGGGDAYIERVDMLGGARNGASLVRSNATVTNARFYVRAQGGRARPVGGTLAGSQNTTVGTDAATALAGVAPYSESWAAPLETLWFINRDGVLVADRAPDAGAAPSGRFRLSQVVPNPERPYFLRFRVRATPSLTRPVAKIVSVSKAGSTTATVTTDGPHGLITGQYVGGYGVRDQTNFANLTTAAPCTVLTANTFTVVWGASVTATSYGGFVFRAQGQQPLGGAIAQVAQTVARTDNMLTLVGNTTWAAPAVVGNIIQLHGVRDGSTGADLGVDGAYVVRDLVTSTLTLEPAYDADGNALAPLGTNITTTNCGGGVIQRFGARIHAIVSTDYNPMLMEPAFKGVTDAGEALTVAGTVAATISSGTITTLTTLTGGGAAEDAAAGTNPVTVGGVVRSAAAPATLVAGDAARLTITPAGAQTVALGAPVASAEVASAARTATGNSGIISVPTGGAIAGLLVVSAQSGTNPTLDVTLEESYDNGTTWIAIWAAPRFAGATGNAIIPAMAVMGLRRWVWTIAGTTPSFTFAINTNQISVAAPIHRNLIDRTIVPTTLNSATPALYIEGCVALSLAVVLGAATTPPVYGIQLSADNVNWYDSGMSLTAVASTTQGAAISGFAAKFARGYVRTAGSTVTQTYVELRGIG